MQPNSHALYKALTARDRRFDGITGRYFDGLKPVRSSEDSYDLGKAADLWDTSQRLVGSPVG